MKQFSVKTFIYIFEKLSCIFWIKWHFVDCYFNFFTCFGFEFGYNFFRKVLEWNWDFYVALNLSKKQMKQFELAFFL